MKYKGVYLEWLDSNMKVTQTDEVVGLATIYTCGFLIAENKEFITVALEHINDNGYDEFRNQVSIPKVVIVKRKEYNL